MSDPVENEGVEKTEPPHEAPPAPPRGVRVMGIVRWVLVVLSALAAVWSWTSYVRGEEHDHGSEAAKHAKKYRCPMHPQVVSDVPGECPICHMTLVPFEEPRTETMAADAGMAALPPDTAPVSLSFDRVQSIGMRTSLAEARTWTAPLRVTAVVTAPEQTASEVHVRASGFVEQLSVRETGIRVRAGQTLLQLYSPEAYQVETELVTAAGFGESGAASVQASRRRLELLGVPSASIDAVLKDKAAARTFPVSAPAGGFVTKKNVVLGSYVTPEMTLYELVDLSRVYVVAEVFPGDVRDIVVGTEGRLTVGAATYDAKVDLIYPEVDPQARTTRVRMQINNEKLELRPGQYGTVEIARAARTVIVVPRDAVVDTGKTAYVFVDGGNGTYTPRIVKLGTQADDLIEIREGVAAGERVVSGATFLVDSESRLRASLAPSSADAGASPCDAEFDRSKYADKWEACQRCEQQHRGMGDMLNDCKNAIAKPWR